MLNNMKQFLLRRDFEKWVKFLRYFMFWKVNCLVTNEILILASKILAIRWKFGYRLLLNNMPQLLPRRDFDKWENSSIVLNVSKSNRIVNYLMLIVIHNISFERISSFWIIREKLIIFEDLTILTYTMKKKFEYNSCQMQFSFLSICIVWIVLQLEFAWKFVTFTVLFFLSFETIVLITTCNYVIY